MSKLSDMAVWGWFASDNDEDFHIGPFPTREEVIAEAIEERLGEYQAEVGQWKLSFYVAEHQALRDIRLAPFFEAGDFFEAIEDGPLEDYRDPEDGNPILTCSKEQEVDLDARVRAAIEEWQTVHGLTFRGYMFVNSRPSERIEVASPALADTIADTEV